MALTRPILLTFSFAAVLALTGSAEAQQLDELNGLWTAKLAGQKAPEAQTESYPEIGVRLRFKDKVVSLTKDTDGTLVSGPTANVGIVGGLVGDHAPVVNPDVKLTIKGLDTPDPSDDSLEGTFFGQPVVFSRDIAVKPPIDITLPGDRPWVRFMREILIPKTAEDRDSYHQFKATEGGAWLKSTQLGSSNYWITKGWVQNQAGWDDLVHQMDGVKNTPRGILKTKFGSLVTAHLRKDKKADAALAMSSLGMYFSTASGGAVRIHVTDNSDSLIYFITDRRANDKTGLVVMKTPLHKPLAASFGKWQNDAGEMGLDDDAPYIRAVVETMCKASTASMNKVSGTGRSAFTDYLGIMAIEDQRGVMFNNDSLAWGRNMTQASFDIMIIRALGHGQSRAKPAWDKATSAIVLSGKQELASQVLVGTQLMPGTPSYIDTLNGAENALAGGTKGGNDCTVSGLSDMESLTTKWLRAEHAAQLTQLEKTLAPFGAAAGSDSIFSTLCDVFYNNDQFGKVTPAQATAIVDASLAIFATIKSDSHNLEKFMLANGITKSADWAPRASGF